MSRKNEFHSCIIADMITKLFDNNIIPGDELYRIVRDDKDSTSYKQYIEELWITYYPYADKDYPQQLAQDFVARFWEMYLTCTLLENKYPVMPKTTVSEGPDIKIENGSNYIYIEAVTPTSGDPNKPDSVPPLKFGVAQQVPDDQMILRYRSVLEDKYKEKYLTYISNGIVSEKDCYVIALNGRKIPQSRSERNIPRIVRSVLPFGHPQVFVDQVSHEMTDGGNQYRAAIKKSCGGNVSTDIFLQPSYSPISAILFSNVDVANLSPIMGGDFVIVQNPLADCALPDNFPGVGVEYKAQITNEVSEMIVQLITKELRIS